MNNIKNEQHDNTRLGNALYNINVKKIGFKRFQLHFTETTIYGNPIILELARE